MRYPNGMIYRHSSSVEKAGTFGDLHCHSGFELLYIISGSMTHVVEDRKYLLTGGDLVLVPHSTYHYMESLADEVYERYNIIFEPERICVDISWMPKDMEVISLLNNPIAMGLFEKLDYYRKGLSVDEFAAVLEQMIRELFLNLRIFSHNQHREKIFLSPILTRALTYINENLFAINDVDEIAQALYISPSNLYYLFRTSLHQTPKKYITEKRLLAAQRKIFAGNKPTEVYKECGFRDYTTFFRSYTARFGHAPSEDGK